ncbi:MAG: tripartite tricarboxylate transporter permease, partial [Bacteroides sp.]
GGDIAALFAYGTAKKVVKNPERPFGEGAMEGIVAPESANNAAVSGAYIPMLTLGIPGDAVAAVVIGALSIHGVTAGPTLIASRPDIFYLMVGGMVVANIFLVIFGLTGLKLFAKIVEVPKQILMPLIMILSVVGSYAINNNIYDVYWMVGFGILGYVFKQYGIPVAPMVLGIILTGIIEENFRRAVLLSGSTPIGFVESMFGAPITTILSLALIFVVCKQAGLFTKIKARINRAKQRDAT